VLFLVGGRGENGLRQGKGLNGIGEEQWASRKQKTVELTIDKMGLVEVVIARGRQLSELWG